MFDNFGINITNIFKKAEEERYKLAHPYVGSEHLLLSILDSDKEISDILRKYNLTYTSFKNELINVIGSASFKSDLVLYTPTLKRIINNALIDAKDESVTSKMLLLSLLEEKEGIAISLLIGMGIDIDSIYEDIKKSEKKSNNNLELFDIGIVLNDKVDLDEVVVGRDKEINNIIEILLRKKKNNPILLGDAGVGKSAIIEELARRIVKKEVPRVLYDMKVVSLDMASLVSGTKYRGEFEERLTNIIKELEENDNIIIFIDEIHTMVNAGGAEGAITAGDIFKPALARGNIKCIGATTKEEYLRSFSSDKALMRRFEIINILEPTKEEVKDILIKVKKEYELHHNVKVSNKVLDNIIYYTDNFIPNKKYPDKAIDFLDSVCSKVRIRSSFNSKRNILLKRIDNLEKEKENAILNNDYKRALNIYNEELIIKNDLNNISEGKIINITNDDLINVLEDKTNIMFTKDKIKELSLIKKKIKSEYIDEIIDVIKNKLLDKKCFIKIYLKGEKHIGKTSLIDNLSSYIKNIEYIKINLNEYKNIFDINKLIGIKDEEGIFNKLKNNLFTIILFDNYNEASKQMKDMINNIINNKYILDNKGEKIYFNNTLIFITEDINVKGSVGFNHNKLSTNNEIELLMDKVIYLNNEKITNN